MEGDACEPYLGCRLVVTIRSPPATVRHPGGNPLTNLKSISHRCLPILVAFVWKWTEETIDLPLGCLQGGAVYERNRDPSRTTTVLVCDHAGRVINTFSLR